jgi:hypothetical protein
MAFILHAFQSGDALKANSAFGPFAKLGRDIFGYKNDVSVPADELIFLGIRLGGDKRKHGSSIGRADGQPAVAVFIAVIADQAESQLVAIEAQALLLIANEDGDVLKTDVGVLAVKAKGGLVDQTARRRAAHARDYKPGTIAAHARGKRESQGPAAGEKTWSDPMELV